MGTFLGMVGFLGFFIFVVLTIISAFKKNGKVKRNATGILVAFIIFCVGVGISPKKSEDLTKENKSVSTAQGIDKNNNTKKEAKGVKEVKTDKQPSSITTNGNLKVHYINVGQADSILIEQNKHFMLIDAGNNNDSNLVVNYLKQQGVSKLDYVIGTHPHEDHIGGLDIVINTFDIGQIFMPKVTSNTETFKDVVIAIRNKGFKITNPTVGNSYNLGNANWTILAPNGSEYKDLNNYSIVTKLKFGNNSFIFTGDAEDVSEGQVLQKQLDIQGDVLKVGHHGSNSSTTDAFLAKVSPKYVVVSVGKGNSYGHPHKPTMDKLKAKNISVYRTDECGTIVATSDGKNITFNTKAGSYNYNGNGAASSTQKNSSTAPKTYKKPVEKPQPKPITGAGSGKIKGNINSKGEKIYHMPGGAYYDKTNPEVWFNTEEEAKAAGFRRSKR